MPSLPRIAAFVLLLLCQGLAAPAGAQALREEQGFLRARIDGRDVRLESLIVRPENATGRLPLALITHGKAASSLSMSDLRAVNYASVARDLARRGWLAAVVVRRGFGQSDGPFPSMPSCGKQDLTQRFASDIDDLEGALRVLRERPDVDPQRIIAIGESAGGATVMGLASRKPEGLRGVVNVAGGLNIEDCVEKGRDALVATVKRWQSAGSAPQLWIYARNDELFPPDLVDRMRTAALDGGGDVRFVALPEMKPRGHQIFRSAPARLVWLREMDASLRAWGGPTWAPATARAAYARLGLTTRADVFERYFSAPGEKAMAYSKASKSFRYWFGAETLTTARENALRDCAKAAGDCVVVFENDQSLPLP